MKCFQCNKEIVEHGIVVNTDGDMVCSLNCKEAYNKEKNHLFDSVVHSPEEFVKWMKGDKK